MRTKAIRLKGWLACLVLVVAAIVGVGAAVAAFADIGAGGSGRPCVGECDKAAWPVWRFGSWSSPEDFIGAESKDTGWSWGSTASSAAGEAYDRALAQCRATDPAGKCDDPVIAAVGYMTVLEDGIPSGVADNVVNEGGKDAMKSLYSQAYGEHGFDTCHTWDLNSDRRVNSCSKMGNLASVNARARQDSNYSDSTLVVMVVLSKTDVNTSMTGEDCSRIVRGGLNNLHFGPDGIWHYDDASGGHYSDLVTSLRTEDSAGNSLKDLEGSTGDGTHGFVWDDTHVWYAPDTSDSVDLDLVPGLSGRIRGVIDSSTGGVPSVIYGSGGVWLYDDGSKSVIKKLDGVVDVSTVVTGEEGIQGAVKGYAVSSDAVWLFDWAGNVRKIMDSVSGVAPSGKIVGVSGASRRMLVYGKQGVWLVWLGSGSFADGQPVSGVDFGSVSEGSIHVERVSTEDVVVAAADFYVTADGSAKYLDFYYDLRGSNTSGRSDVGYELRDVTGDQLAGVKGIVSGDGETFVYSDTAAWTLSFGSISYVENKPDAVGKSIRYAVAKRVPGITGKIIGTRQAFSYGNSEVVTTDGIWAFNRSGSFVLPDGLPSGLKHTDGYYPGKGEYATPDAIREPIVVSSMSVSNGYFVDLNGDQIKVDGKPVEAFKLTDFLTGGLGGYSVYGGSRYYFTYHDDRGDALPVNVNKTPIMCYAVDYVVKAGDKDVTSETDAPGTQFVLWGRSLTLPALHKIPDGWLFDDKWCQGYDCDHAVNTVFTPTGDVTFEGYLKPVVHLSFNLSEAEGQPDASKTPATQALRQGQLGVKPTPDPSWTGRHFENWYLKNDDGSRGDRWDFGWRTVDSDTTLYARWQVKQFFKSTVDGCKLDDWQYTHDRTFDYGSKAESVGDPSCGKADFVGWVKDDPKSTVVVHDLSTVTLDKDTTFYAKWAPKQVKLSFRKVDAADHGKHLSGAEFTITGPGLSEPLKVTSNDDGMVNFRLPTNGSPYLVAESKAPEGYSGEVSFKLTVPSSDWRDFKFSDVTCSDGGSACLSGSAGDFLDESDDDGPDGYVNDLSNIADIDHFPQTGRGGVAVFPFVGGLLIIMAGIIAVVLRRRSHGGADGSGNGVVDSVSDSVSDPASVSGDPFKSVDVEIPVSHPVDGEL